MFFYFFSCKIYLYLCSWLIYLEILLIKFPKVLPPFFLAMAPIMELRLALVVAIFSFKMRPLLAFFWAVAGNTISVTVWLLVIEKLHKWIESKSGFVFGKKWANYIVQSQKRFVKYEKYGLVGIFVFIASTLPGTGAYAAGIAAFVLGIPFKKSWPYFFAGLIVTALVTLAVTVGLDKIF